MPGFWLQKPGICINESNHQTRLYNGIDLPMANENNVQSGATWSLRMR